MFKITFNLASPVSFIEKPTFDAILAYAYAKEHFRVLPQPMHIVQEELLDFKDLPITQHENGYFLASYLFYDKDTALEHCQKWRKRWANKHDKLADFGKKGRRRVKIDSGNFKSYDIPFLTITTPKVWFFFHSDNVKEVERLITKHIHFLGKKRSQGFGEIRDFQIEEVPDSRIIRPIPMKLLSVKEQEGKQIQRCSWKPPYWNLDNHEVCVVS